MRIAFALIAAGAFVVSGCKTTETALADGHEVFVSIDREFIEDDGDKKGHVNIIIKRDGEDTIHIEGDPASPEVKKQLAMLGAEGIHVMGGDHNVHLAGPDGMKHKRIMKHDTENSFEIILEGDEVADLDGHYMIIKKGSGPDGDTHHMGVHKKVIVIKGGSEEEIREQLKKEGIELEFDLELDDEEKVEK